MKTKNGFNNIETIVQQIWTMENLSEAKQLLIDTINNELTKATKIKKYQLVEGVKNARSKARVDQMAASIMFQDSKSTSSFNNL
tara:strand:+ start:437 stop:688 length:252 start_codon:yes stop_codon:yes gene_type:complete